MTVSLAEKQPKAQNAHDHIYAKRDRIDTARSRCLEAGRGRPVVRTCFARVFDAPIYATLFDGKG